jgi:2'-5' RNA ligase
MKTNIFLALLPGHDNRLALAQKILACEAKRSPLARINWTNNNDLHITLGYIPEVNESDIRAIALGMSIISQSSALMASGEQVKLYGNAIVLKIEPYQVLSTLNKKMNQKLIEITNQQYHFEAKHRFDPHLTIGRIQNLQALSALHKEQLISLIETQFTGYSFLIQQAALMRRLPEKATSPYQSIQLYNLRR